MSTWFANARRRLKKDSRRATLPCWPSPSDRRPSNTDTGDAVVMATGSVRDDDNFAVSVGVGKGLGTLCYSSTVLSRA